MCFVGLVFTDDPIAICCLLLRGRIYSRGYGAQFQPAVDRDIDDVSLILLPMARRLCAARRVGLYGVLGFAFLYYLATIELARYLGANRLRLLLATEPFARGAEFPI